MDSWQLLIGAVILGGFLAGLLLLLLLFLRADADLLLLLQKPAPPDAFKNKVVWVTGASQGIGLDLCLLFASLGARLVLSSRSEEKLKRAKETCLAASPSALVEILPLDLAGGGAALTSVVEAAEKLFGGAGVDVLVHNAAYPRPKITCQETSEEILRAMFEVNVFGTIELTRALIPSMTRRGRGQIVVVSSAAAKVPSPTQGVYAATKHALNGYFRTLHYELVQSGVSVTVACPGPIATSTQQAIPATSSHGDTAAEGAAGGAAGDEEEQRDRMTSLRCAQLIVTAAHHKLPEAWISKQPILAVLYIAQYLPLLAHILLKKVGPKRVAALREGRKDLYSASILFGASKDPKKDL